MSYLVACLWDPIHLELSTAKETPHLLGSLAAFAWPLITIVGLWIYRVPLGKFLETIGSRATEIGIGWASIKLPDVKQASPTPVNVARELQSDLWQESSSQWFREFSSSTASSEYALLNVGDGREWISSRLFIFAVMLQRMKSLKCIVFTRLLASGDSRFLGCASPENIRWALAVDQPWLETAYAHAYANLFPPQIPDPAIPSPSFIHIDGSIEPDFAERAVREFISSLRGFPGNPYSGSPGWVDVSGSKEHASWLTETELQRIIGVHLWRDAVEGRVDDSNEQKMLEAKQIVGKSSPYVAILKGGFYKSLIDRIALLSEIGRSVL
jgi:hypothetical protein